MGWHAFAKYMFIFPIFDESTSIPSSSFDIFCFEFQRAWNWSSFLKRRSLPYGFFVFSFKESIDFRTSRKNNTVKNNERAHRVDFDEKNHAFPMW